MMEKKGVNKRANKRGRRGREEEEGSKGGKGQKEKKEKRRRENPPERRRKENRRKKKRKKKIALPISLLIQPNPVPYRVQSIPYMNQIIMILWLDPCLFKIVDEKVHIFRHVVRLDG